MPSHPLATRGRPAAPDRPVPPFGHGFSVIQPPAGYPFVLHPGYNPREPSPGPYPKPCLTSANLRQSLARRHMRLSAGALAANAPAAPARWPLTHQGAQPRSQNARIEDFTSLESELVVLIDEADGLLGPAMISFLTQRRQGYIALSPTPFPHSIVLVGIRQVRVYALMQDERRTVSWSGRRGGSRPRSDRGAWNKASCAGALKA